MKKTVLSIAFLSATIAHVFAGSVTTSTTVMGKNNGSTVSGSTVSINCDNTVQIECYTVTVTTSNDEIAGTFNPGDPVTINPCDQKGNPTQQLISGTYIGSFQQPDPNNQNVTDYFYNLNFQQ